MKRKAMQASVRRDVLNVGPCAYCGDPFPTQVDHVMPVSRGGSDDPANLVPACQFCNWEKLDFTADEWREWREATGRPWPPRSMPTVLREVIGAIGVDALQGWSEAMGSRASETDQARAIADLKAVTLRARATAEWSAQDEGLRLALSYARPAAA